ncbi:MAG: hypothetical protein ACRDY4_09710 [Acidimicrobiia bacterium]
MGELRAHGLVVDVPPGWDGRITRRPEHGDVSVATADAPPATPGFSTRPVTHVASIALPGDMADFGADVVEDLGPDDAFVALVEYDPASAGTTLFTAQGVPRSLDPELFSPTTLQRSVPGQAGLQRFFSEQGRALCLYVVLGSYARRHDVVPRVDEVLASVQVAPLAPGPE